jgi:type VI secretion system protein ImpJ
MKKKPENMKRHWKNRKRNESRTTSRLGTTKDWGRPFRQKDFRGEKKNMTSPTVHWHEGMFLRPQHFQTAQRAWTRLLVDNASWDHHYNWGLRSLQLDMDALANYRCVVRSLEARLRDGTPVVITADEPLTPVPLRTAFEKSNSITIYVGVPLFNLNRANAANRDSGGDSRYLVETQELEDENTGQNTQRIPVRQLHVKILLSTQSLSGYEVLPLARLEKSARAESTPEIDEKYVPPLLACDAWKPLNNGLLMSLFDRIGKKIELLANQVVAQGLAFDSNTQGEVLTFNQLRELNQAHTTLGVLVFAQGIHPLLAYGELCRLIGQLAIFGPERRPPDLLGYDHDDLAKCFYQARRHIDNLLDIFVEPEYKERAFIGAGLRMQVSMEPAWMETTWQLFLGVRSTLSKEECVRLLTKTGHLDMKIGSSDRVDSIYREGSAGLKFTHNPHPPRALPTPPGQVYFQVLNEARDPEWQQVKKSLTLAIRLNENLIAGTIEGQRMLTIRHGGQTVPLQFTLYVLPMSSTK